MKLNWVSPFPPARTDIGQYTARLLPALAHHFDVTLWAENDDASLPTGAPAQLRLASQIPAHWPSLNFADLTVYQVGNDARFHGWAVRSMKQHPGIVILHDTSVHELYRGLMHALPSGEDSYLPTVLRYEGEDALHIASALANRESSAEEASARLHLSGWICENALGVIIHNPDEFARLSPLIHAPLTCLPLPYKSLAALRPVPARSFSPAKDKLRLIVFGFLNSPNRRLSAILEALASFPHRSRIHLDIVGDLPNKADVASQAHALGIHSLLSFHGFVSDDRLASLLDSAHLALNLRNPTRGEASGSQLRIWEHALPSLITPLGWYKHVPQGTAFHVSPHNEIADLHAHWQAFLSSPDPYLAAGLAGHAHLKSAHTAEQYAASLHSFFSSVIAWRGHSLLPKLAHRYANLLLADFDSAPQPQALLHKRLSRELAHWASAPCA